MYDSNFTPFNETYNLPFSNLLANSIRKMARLTLVPYFQEIIVDYSDTCPIITPLAKGIFKSVFNNGELTEHIFKESKIIANSFVSKLRLIDKECLKFYFLTNESSIKQISDELKSTSDYYIENNDLGRSLNEKLQNLTDNDLINFLLEELRHIEDILSDETTSSWDQYSIQYVNENFADYLGIRNLTIQLIPIQVDEEEHWETIFEDYEYEDNGDEYEDDDERFYYS